MENHNHIVDTTEGLNEVIEYLKQHPKNECEDNSALGYVVDRILKNHNIQRNSQSWFDYSKAKEVIFGDDWLKDHRHYNQIIKEICDYLVL